jgi:hypothetical protein
MESTFRSTTVTADLLVVIRPPQVGSIAEEKHGFYARSSSVPGPAADFTPNCRGLPINVRHLAWLQFRAGVFDRVTLGQFVPNGTTGGDRSNSRSPSFTSNRLAAAGWSNAKLGSADRASNLVIRGMIEWSVPALNVLSS